MIEPIMYLAIGFLLAMLLGLMILPLVHNRAVRLTTRRMEAATPLSMAEIQADKDQLRAEFAMSARRLEMSVDKLKHQTTSQLAELGKKTDAINRMKLELGEKNATIFSLEAREKAMKEQQRATEEEFTTKTDALRQAERALSDKQGELAKLNSELTDRSSMAESRKVELAALNAQVAGLKGRVGDAEKEFAATQTRLEQERGQSEAATRDLTEARGRVENLSQRVTDLDRQLVALVKEAELLSNRVNDLETRLATQGKLLAERNYETNQLRQPRAAGVGEAEDREGGGRGTASRGARRTHQAATRHQRDPAAGGKRMGDRAHGERAAARAHQRHRRRSRQACDAARRTELADRGALGGGAGEGIQRHHGERCRRRQRRRRRRNAGRAHPRAAVARLPRPPAGGVKSSSRAQAKRSRFDHLPKWPWIASSLTLLAMT